MASPTAGAVPAPSAVPPPVEARGVGSPHPTLSETGATAPVSDHLCLAAASGRVILCCPHCFHVQVRHIRWLTPRTMCACCLRQLRIGVCLSAAPDVSWTASGRGIGLRLNRRTRTADATDCFAQHDGYVRYRCDCGLVRHVYPSIPDNSTTCKCGRTVYVNLILWTLNHRGVLPRKALPDDWLVPPPAERERLAAPHRRRTRPYRKRHGTLLTHLDAPLRLGRPRKGETRSEYLARLAAVSDLRHGGAVVEGSDGRGERPE